MNNNEKENKVKRSSIKKRIQLRIFKFTNIHKNTIYFYNILKDLFHIKQSQFLNINI